MAEKKEDNREEFLAISMQTFLCQVPLEPNFVTLKKSKMDKMIANWGEKNKEPLKKGDGPKDDKATSSRVNALESKVNTLIALVKYKAVGSQKESVKSQSPMAREDLY
uniref:Uncharacterized protein n=1 Tax=Romanomermis culicivorax TaxID=13658 RepID=A0A915KNV9_ROMCU